MPSRKNIRRTDYMRRPSAYDYATPEMRSRMRQAVVGYLSPTALARRALYPVLEPGLEREFPYTMREVGRGLVPEEEMRPDIQPLPTVSIPLLRKIPSGRFGAKAGQEAEEMAFKHVDRLPALTEKVAKPIRGTKEVVKKYANNPAHRELTAIYNKGGMPLEEVEGHFLKNVIRDEMGLSVFDRILRQEIAQRQSGITPGKRYKIENFNVTTGASNQKVGKELVPMDTSKGCLEFCSQCYAAGLSKQAKICFHDPSPVRLTGSFYDDPDKIRRIGEVGEPSFHPGLYEEVRDEYLALFQKPRGPTAEELLDIQARTSDWSWTNNQLIKTDLHTPGNWVERRYQVGGKDRTFLITKLPSIKNFNPLITKNLEVSVDPFEPHHFFRTLKNVKALKAQYGDNVNIMLRIRSVATQSDEINSMQKMAVDFANKHNIPVLETRMRLKSPEGAALAQTLPEYFYHGRQKHISYYPTQDIHSKHPRIGKSEIGKKKRLSQEITNLEIATPDGPIESDVYIIRNWAEKLK